ncbi:MAG: hypothetical protein KJ574_04380 [Nanoarchaeota archaeon]|nr:hypothetical protein [Nanoarchaeota archaeon]
MGFFARLFKKEKKEESVYPVETVLLSDLQKWFMKQTSTRFKDLEKDMIGSFHVIEKETEELKHHLKKLKDASLMNPNIPEKERQIMEGNRNSYLQQHAVLLAQTATPEQINYKTALEYTKRFHEAAKILVKSTAKNSQVLKFFFEHELFNVTQRIKVITEEVDRMTNWLNDDSKGVAYVEQVNEKINSFIGKCKHRKELMSKMDEEKKKLENSRVMKRKFEKEVEAIKSMQEYSDFERLNTQRDTLISDMKQLEADLHHVFSQIDKPLRKYERVAVEDVVLVADYNSDSISALLGDEEFKIIKILESMKTAIQKGSIELKESDKEKVLQRIGNLNKEFFKNFVFRYDDVKKAKRKIDDQIRNNGTLRKLDDFAYKIRHTEEQIARAEDSIKQISEKLEKLALERVKQELEYELRLMTQLDVKIDVDNGG